MGKQDIKYDQRNYRDHDERNLSLIKKSIQRCGAGRSILLDKNGEIIAGNATYKTLQELGIPVKIIPTDGKTAIALQRTDLDTNSRKRKELAAFDNSTSDKVHWNFDNIAADFDLSELPDFGIEALPDMEPVEPVEEDDVPDVSKAAPRAKKGDIWKLGEHRLMCGDSTVIADVEKLMGGEKADMVLSDPPYGMHLDTDFSDCIGSIGRKNSTKGNKYDPVIGDNEDFTSDLINTFFINFNYVKEMFLFGADYFAELLPDRNKGSFLVWDKRKESQANAIGSEFELIWSKNKHKRRVLRFDWFGFLSSKDAKDARNRVHPTQKPVSLLAEIIKQWGKDLTVIVDLFGGSGTTLIACEQLGRKARLMEIDPHYCDVIITRWETLTGKQARLLEA